MHGHAYGRGYGGQHLHGDLCHGEGRQLHAEYRSRHIESDGERRGCRHNRGVCGEGVRRHGAEGGRVHRREPARRLHADGSRVRQPDRRRDRRKYRNGLYDPGRGKQRRDGLLHRSDDGEGRFEGDPGGPYGEDGPGDEDLRRDGADLRDIYRGRPCGGRDRQRGVHGHANGRGHGGQHLHGDLCDGEGRQLHAEYRSRHIESDGERRGCRHNRGVCGEGVRRHGAEGGRVHRREPARRLHADGSRVRQPDRRRDRRKYRNGLYDPGRGKQRRDGLLHRSDDGEGRFEGDPGGPYGEDGPGDEDLRRDGADLRDIYRGRPGNGRDRQRGVHGHANGRGHGGQHLHGDLCDGEGRQLHAEYRSRHPESDGQRRGSRHYRGVGGESVRRDGTDGGRVHRREPARGLHADCNRVRQPDRRGDRREHGNGLYDPGRGKQRRDGLLHRSDDGEGRTEGDREDDHDQHRVTVLRPGVQRRTYQSGKHVPTDGDRRICSRRRPERRQCRKRIRRTDRRRRCRDRL